MHAPPALPLPLTLCLLHPAHAPLALASPTQQVMAKCIKARQSPIPGMHGSSAGN